MQSDLTLKWVFSVNDFLSIRIALKLFCNNFVAQQNCSAIIYLIDSKFEESHETGEYCIGGTIFMVARRNALICGAILKKIMW